MKKCLKIVLRELKSPEGLIQDIQKKGTKLILEGTIQYIASERELRIIVCGIKDAVDALVDAIHKQSALLNLSAPDIEPFVKTKDYRGAFRIIE